MDQPENREEALIFPQNQEVILHEEAAAEADDEAGSEISEDFDDDFFPPNLREDLRERFQSLSLTREELKEVDNVGYQEAYLRKALRQMYDRPSLTFSCTHCAILCVFHGSGVVTDGELEELYYGPGR
eukprot:gene44856-54865_t